MVNTTTGKNAAILTIAISIILLICKFIAFFITGSKAALSDAIESIINVTTSFFLLFSLTISNQPADQCHPYGHGKIESFSAGLEGGLIFLAGIIILIEAVPSFFTPEAPKRLDLGIIILLGAGIVNFIQGRYLLYQGRKTRSEALVASGHHLLTDFYTSAGVIIGLILVRVTGILWIDPLIACLVAINILIPGLRLTRKAIKNLMDEADPEILDRVTDALRLIEDENWLCPHKLRVLRSGNYHHIDLHITLPNFLPLQKAHSIEKRVAGALLDTLGADGDVMIHLDPCEPSCCSCCNQNNCPERTKEFHAESPWTIESITADQPLCKNKTP
ncbi:MAG: cation diffusion facilitator family transporter [Proteobacteria bacterium]|nr:cation diffusion facilitator family transporter [Pseudomonadota bacterium]